MRKYAPFLLGLSVLAAADEDPTGILMRLRDQVLEYGERIPNHTCIETVQRDSYRPTDGRPTSSCDDLLARRKELFPSRFRIGSTDRLRLDVLFVDGREIFSWAGTGKFHEGEIDELVPGGAIGTGQFAAMLQSVFEPSAARFLFDGRTTRDGRKVCEYSFEVPRERSGYRVKAGRDWVTTGFSGKIRADAQTAALVRFTLRTDELPAGSNACETESTLDYGTVRLGSNDYLLPAAAHQRFIGRDGSEMENTMTFSACREFKSESTVSFGERPAADGTADGAAPQLRALPPDLPVTVELTTTVHLDTAAAGDRVEGRLAGPLEDKVQRVTLAPQGARLEGRLMRVEIRYSLPIEFTVALRWESLELNGIQIPVYMNPVHEEPGPKIRGLIQRGVEIELPAPGQERYGLFHFRGEHALMKSGFRSKWVTARP